MRRLPARHRAWVVAKLAVILWLVVYAIVTPPATSALLGGFVWVWVGVAVAGVVLSVVGMVMAVQRGHAKRGRMLELAGLILAIVGPLIHAVTLCFIIVPLYLDGGDWTGRLGPLGQSVAIIAFLRVRYVEVRDRIGGAR
ncbi:hypothetical protein O1W71_16285 [Microbacterium sp. H37-C3]|uniref:hypothetical protein n=1 Tax=Microbacterium sp. H37-C3 TaxID=3004354 RepID=UPI0022AEC1E4|nr:hypothetical protein [Microbacterium sp. H37-C3]MCZ4069231.1 hypothetical protein [Microbacterium sp. H37-C3]